MSQGPQDSRRLGLYFALGQVGIEMAVPILLGFALDRYLGWAPWCMLGGLVVGFTGGLMHLWTIVKNLEDLNDKERKPPDKIP